jgi:hypothetical protein
VSYEVANATESLGQFASGKGYDDLIAASKLHGALVRFFETGETTEVESCIAELGAIAKEAADAGVRSTAAGLAELMRGQEVAIITDGVVASGEELAASEGGTMRAPVGVERCLAASEIIGALDKGRDDVAAALRAARARVQAGIINRLLALPVRKMHRASVEADAKLTGEVKAILEGIAAFGKKQIGDERARQLAGRPAPTAAVVRGADADQEPVGLYADAVVSEWENVVQARATSAMMARRVRQNASVGALITGVGEDLDEQSDKWVDGVASKGANEAFAAGRDEGFAQYADEIDHYVYSAMLDFNCCGNCAAADGAEGTAEEVPSVPNEECDGGDRCRCVLVAVFKDEGTVAA